MTTVPVLLSQENINIVLILWKSGLSFAVKEGYDIAMCYHFFTSKKKETTGAEEE